MRPIHGVSCWVSRLGYLPGLSSPSHSQGSFYASIEKKMADRVICIRIKETLGEDWSQWFDGLAITPDKDGNTLLQGTLPDQSALRGVLCRLWDLKLTILSFSFDEFS
jgi:hypothetical protein